jgi:hypothetical protein
MLITITRSLDRVPNYPTLLHLAAHNKVQLAGNEHGGSFSWSGGKGQYELGEGRVQGKLEAHGVSGEFLLEAGKATVTVTTKPFWMPETLLRSKLTEGLESLCTRLNACT